MKNRRRQVFLGLVLLAATFLFTIQDGVLGHLMAQFLGYLFGQSGAAVAAVLMLTAGVLLVVPPGAVGRLVRWSTHSREARVETVMREMDDDVIAQAVERAVEKALRGRSKVESPVVSGTIMSPDERKKLDDVRVALRSLQWKASEFEPLVRDMDPSVPFDTLVRSAIKQLSEKRN